MEEIKMLHRKRGAISAQITIFSKFLNETVLPKQDDLTPVELDMLNQRLSKITPLLDNFEAIQTDIDILEDDEEKSMSARELFLNNYFSVIGQANVIKSRYEKVSLAPTSFISAEGQAPGDKHLLSNVKLPTIELPTFDGSFLQWREFCDVFGGLIHRNEALSNGQKLFYLRASLKGEPAEMINSLDTTDLNYAIAWDLLKKRYDNKRRIIKNHVQAILNLSPITKNSNVQLRQFINTIETNMRCLTALKQMTQAWDPLITQIILNKLDLYTNREWEAKLNQNDSNEKIPTYSELMSFLNSKLNTLEAVNFQKPVTDSKTKSSPFRAFACANQGQCFKCNGNHFLSKCEDFLKLPVEDRSIMARKAGLCLNCLRKGHFLSDCKSSNCKKCDRKHNTLLHITRNNSSNRKEIERDTNETNDENVTCAISYTVSVGQVLLPTAKVKCFDRSGNQHTLRVLLDSASQSNFISQNACEMLGLKQRRANISSTGITQDALNLNHRADVKVFSMHNDYSVTLGCFVLPRIISNTPSIKINVESFEIPSHIKLADPSFSSPSEVDLLIGAGLFYELLCVGQIKAKGFSILQKTKFGWVVSGNAVHEPQSHAASFLTLETLHEELQSFWKIDNVDNEPTSSLSDQYCEQYFNETTTRDENGRFIVRIPFQENLEDLGNSFKIAEKRFSNLERKFVNNISLKESYAEFMSDYQNLNHMTKLKGDCSESGFYLPHHAIFKEDSETTKVRVAFDGSCKPEKGLSINALQHTGPTLQNDLFNVLLIFRKYAVALTADAAKMYRQIWVHPQDRKYQKILWRWSPNEELSTYELNTVTYGLTASSFLAIRCLMQLAKENEISYPDEANMIRRQFYVDDFLGGSNNIQEAKEIKANLITIFQQGGFQLRKWKSNVPELNEDTNHLISLSTKKSKALGMYWNTASDEFFYSISDLRFYSEVTKRTILSVTTQLYDPLGLLAPVIIIPKLIIQKIWQLNLKWDESIPLNVHTEWLNFRNNLKYLNNLTVSRFVLRTNGICLEMHGFSDASTRGYGACIYLKTIDNTGKCSAKLLTAKSRVAPLKNISLPRLELLGAVLLSQLATKVVAALDLNNVKQYFWTDSQIVLCWIQSPSNRWATFVANRVSLIQQQTAIEDWHHVTSVENPADLISRGCSPKEIVNATLWWNGPEFLQNYSKWPKEVETLETSLEQKIKVKSFVSLERHSFDYEQFSTFNRLLRSVSYCIRFASNCRKPVPERQHGNLTKSELDNALVRLIKQLQIQEFNEDYSNLLYKKPISSKSRILSLTPFMDSNGIMRVGGRLSHSNFPYEKKHPILLPHKHHFTKLILEHYHVMLLHAPSGLLLSSIREKYWPIAGRSLAKATVRKCIRCFRYNSKPETPIMGNLPSSRFQQSFPFITVGIDYAGPLLIRNKRGRVSRNEKCYICLFICLATKAIHLEPVTDLTTSAFIASFRRFIARRGKPMHVYSDNGKNFVGAKSEINDLYNFINENNQSICDQLTKEGLEWHFIPPLAPHFDGLWEAGVKSVKYHLKRVTHAASLTYEDLYTILTQIEAVLNSRPISPLSSDPNDYEPLTPAHFVIGRTYTSIPEENLNAINQNRLDRFRHFQQIVQHFWTRWSLEYVADLQQRTKWRKNCHQIDINDLVLLKDENQPPAKWSLGRVMKLHPGADDCVRVVTVKCANGVFKRPVTKLCVLPLNDC